MEVHTGRSAVPNRSALIHQEKQLPQQPVSAPQGRTEAGPWSQENLDRSLEGMNELSIMKERSLKFEQHDTLDRTMVKIIDRETDEVVRELPPEEFLDMISSMLEFAGLLFDRKV
ncbi:flagellar protein FlaG [Alkalicoccus luteus]|uniref:Flagellar protein FlaG n=1 Tax=Alkalicoccus luteus TaxID=1237094 RepID=A0A969PSD8_9BACI|nr:flagellar protein FlaG [Alkalicoccus luteus]NJP37083.1 flagellar protein FlaG [Alkalicoccus luteus]